MSRTTTAKSVITHPCFALATYFGLCSILPQYGGTAATILGSAALLTTLIWVSPDSLRNRSSSLSTAVGLVATMWLMATIVTALTLLGKIL